MAHHSQRCGCLASHVFGKKTRKFSKRGLRFGLSAVKTKKDPLFGFPPRSDRGWRIAEPIVVPKSHTGQGLDQLQMRWGRWPDCWPGGGSELFRSLPTARGSRPVQMGRARSRNGSKCAPHHRHEKKKPWRFPTGFGQHFPLDFYCVSMCFCF